MSSVSPTTPAAVFVSYAREDAEPARLIADALRAFGVEVWFDQNELRGGDTWDAKIRQQIRECRLFLPLVSARTQARHEGYFRREWKLAVERTHDMAQGIAFIVPVVIDDTTEGEALVPEEFMRVQWTRLPNGVPSPDFVAQVKRLLEAPKSRVAVGLSAPAGPPRRQNIPTRRDEAVPGRGSRATKWTWVAVSVAAAVAIGLWLWLRRPAAESRRSATVSAGVVTPAARSKSVAVLPFDNLSRDPQNEVFTDGMHDDVITALTKIHDLRVISRSSVLSYKPGTRNLRAIAAELDVAHILEGSVQRDGSRVKLNVQLTDAQTARQLWSDNYTEQIADTFAVQEKLAQAITTALQARFSPQERTLIGRRVTESEEAYALFMRASRLEDSASQRGDGRKRNEEAIALYEQAVVKDPRFALAYAKLSAVHGLFYWFSWGDDAPSRREKAKAALDAAERLAPDAPETMMARGVYAYRCEGDFERALAHHLAAERGLPNDAELQGYIGATLRRLGRFPEAAVRFQRAAALNPRALAASEGVAQALFFLGRFAEVERFVQQKRGVFPDAIVLEEIAAKARAALDGNHQQLVATYRRIRGPTGLSYSRARKLGDLNEAEAALVRSAGADQSSDGPELHRMLLQTQLAWVRGQRDAARSLAAAALAELKTRAVIPRLESRHLVSIALALAFLGRGAEAAAKADESFTAIFARDKFAAITHGFWVAEVHLVAGNRDRAFEYLRQSCAAGVTDTALELRHDPIWAPLRDDPRFEEALKLLQPR